MKRIKIGLILLLAFMIMPGVVSAASGSISVKSANTAVVGNKVTVTVTLSSSTSIGSWQMDLNYDKKYLQLVSSSAEAGGTRMVDSSNKGVKSKSYTFSFKTLKSGSTNVSVSSYLAYSFADFSEINLKTSTKTIKIMTQAEMEATYSSNANLSSLKVDNYELTPVFNKSVFEYNIEVENDIGSVKVSATKEDNAASISGTGDIELTEGNNKVMIEVTAQKGNTQTYVVNIYRKELDPISLEVKNKTYNVVRKADSLPELSAFTATTINIEGSEIPALYSEITGLTLIGLKDEEGQVYTYIFADDQVTDRYEEVSSNSLTIYPLSLPTNETFKNYTKKKIEFNGYEVEAYFYDSTSTLAIVYAQDITTGDIRYYYYDMVDKVIMKYDPKIAESYNEQLTKTKYVLYGFIVLSVILIFILIIKKPKKQPKMKNDKIKDIPEIKITEEQPKIDKTEDKKLAKEQKKLAKKAQKKKKDKNDFDF